MTTSTVRRLVPLAAAAAVLAVLVGSAFLLRGSGGSGTGGSDGSPPLLHLSTSSVARDAAGPGAGRGLVTLDGDLPDGPDEAEVRRLGSVRDAAVEALAGALGADTVVRHQDGDQPGAGRDGQAVLRVTADGQWFYERRAMSCPDLPTTGEQPPDAVVGCVVPQAAGETAPRGPSVSDERAIEAATPVLEAVGLDAGDATVTAAGPAAQVSVDPEVAGLPTSGLSTSVDVDGDGIVRGQGLLADTRAGPSYPVISAQDAFDQLARIPVPMTAIACPEQQKGADPGRAVPPCGPRYPMTVVGAAFGLSMQYDGERPLLVPSWLFDVEGLAEPLAQVAVDPAYLAGPEPAPTGSDDPGTGGGGVPGSPGTATPVDPADPTMPTAEPPTGARFTDVALADDGRTLTVTFFGGVEECYDYAVTAEETADTVSLTLVEKAVPGDRACIELAQEHKRKVTLREPLGDRRVVDAESRRAVTVRGQR